MSTNIQLDKILKQLDIKQSELRDALRGTDSRDLSQLYDILRGRVVREFYEDDFSTDDAWLWNKYRGGTVSGGVLILSNGQQRGSTRYLINRGSALIAKMKWGITAQTGADRRFGWGSSLGSLFVGFRLTDAFYAVVRIADFLRSIDITADLPTDYDTAFHYYGIIIDARTVYFYIDGTLVASTPLAKNTSYFRDASGLIWLRNADTITGDMEFDWVRIAYFTPRENLVPTSQENYLFSGSVAGGTGTTVAWSYTVPEGKRARLECAQVLCDTDSVNGVYGVINVYDGTYNVRVAMAGQTGGIPLGTKDIQHPRVELLSGMKVEGTYGNGDTVNHVVDIRALITELE